jgi:hypothetical protein
VAAPGHDAADQGSQLVASQMQQEWMAILQFAVAVYLIFFLWSAVCLTLG